MTKKAIITRIIFYGILITLGLTLPTACMTVGKHTRFHKSFIVDIDTPGYGNDNTKLYLDYFNNLGDNGAVSYSPSEDIDRRITITEVKTIPGNESTVGLAFVRWNKCSILIESDLDSYSYTLALYHEYLHCMGYNHVDNEQDLMYYSLTWPDIANIKKYAQELKNRRKNLKK